MGKISKEINYITQYIYYFHKKIINTLTLSYCRLFDCG